MNSKTCWFLVISVVLLICVTQVNSQKLANDTDVDEKIRKIANRDNVGSITAWVNMGAGIRRSATKTTPNFEEIFAGGFSQAGAVSVAKIYAALLFMLAFSLLFAVGSCIMWPSYFCCRACGACGGDKPRDGGYSKNEKIAAAVTMGVALFLILLGCIVGLVTNALITTGIEEAILSVNETANDAADFPGVVGETLNLVLDDVDQTIDDVFDLIRSVPDSVVGKDGSLSVFVGNLTSVIRSLQGSFDKIVSEGTNLDNSIQDILAKLDSLSLETQDLNNQIAAFSVDQTYYANNSVTFKVNSTCLQLDNIQPITIANASGVLPPVGELISNVNVNLSSIADTIQTTFDSIQTNLTALIDEQFASVRSQIDQATGSVSTFVNDALNQITGSFDTVRSYQGQIDTFYQRYIVTNNRYRSIGTIILFCLNILIIILAVLGLVLKKSPIMTAGINIAFFLMIIFWIVCFIHLIIAVPVGKICDVVLNRELAPLLAAVAPTLYNDLNNQFANMGSNSSNSSFPNPLIGRDLEGVVNLVFDTLDDCRGGGNLITYLNLSDFINIDSYIDEALSQFNLNDTIDNIQISNDTFGNLDLTGQINFDTLVDELQSVNNDFEAYVNLIESILINSTENKANTSKIIVTAARDDIPLIENCLIISTDVDASDKTAMAKNISQQLDTTAKTLNNILDVSIPAIRSDIDLIRSKFQNFTNAVTTGITGDVDEILTFISGIETELFNIIVGIKNKLKSETVPQVVGEVRGLADQVESRAVGLGDCQFLGEDVYAILNSVCVTSMGGIDSVWYTAGYLGLSLIVVIVGIALYSKRWIRADPMDQDQFSDQYYKDKEFELPPMYSDDQKE